MAIITRGDIFAKRLPKIFIVFHVLILCLSMVVTPKKVVRSDLFCFLCASTLGKDRVRIFGKRSVDSRSYQKYCWHGRDRIFVARSFHLRSALLQATPSLWKLSSTSLEFKDEIKKDFDKGCLRTKRLRKDSTAEEGLVVEKLQHISHEESSLHSFARSCGAERWKNGRSGQKLNVWP